MHDELAAQVAEPDSLLTHARSLSKRWCERVRRPLSLAIAMPETSVVNAWITLPQGFPDVKLQFDRRVRIRNYSRLACHLPFPVWRGTRGAD